VGQKKEQGLTKSLLGLYPKVTVTEVAEHEFKTQKSRNKLFCTDETYSIVGPQALNYYQESPITKLKPIKKQSEGSNKKL